MQLLVGLFKFAARVVAISYVITFFHYHFTILLSKLKFKLFINKTDEELAIEYYKEHGKQCPHCGYWVPIHFCYCQVCSKDTSINPYSQEHDVKLINHTQIKY